MKRLLSKVTSVLLCLLMITGTLPALAGADDGTPYGAPTIAGDISGDTLVNNQDAARLFQYLSGWDVPVVKEALDVNGDQLVNNQDLVLLFQYVSGLDVHISVDGCNHEQTELRNEKAATCLVEGYSGDTYCKICNMRIQKGSVLPKADHTGGTATCHSKAICDVCGIPYGETDPDNHDGTTYTIGDHAATCFDNGYTGDVYCGSCNTKISDGEVIAAAGSHGSLYITNEKDATCEEDGYTGDAYCSVCNNLINSGTVIPATGHTVLEATYHSKSVCKDCLKEFGGFADIKAYDQLSENQKNIYNAIEAAVSRLDTEWFDVPITNFADEDEMNSDVRVALHAVAYDNPEYFWMPKTYSMRPDINQYTGLRKYEISFSFDSADAQRGYYNVTADEKDAMQAQLEQKISEILSVANTFETDFQKERYIHDYLCDNITYDYATALAQNGYIPPDGDDFVENAVQYASVDDNGNLYYRHNPWAFTIYGALIEGVCVCEGYSRAMQLLMNRLGIPCNLISGLAQGGPHMWNIINIQDELYYIDVTFDDRLEGSGIDLPGLHTYFNLSAEKLSADHSLDDIYSDSADYSNPGSDFNFFQTYEDKTEYYYYTKVGAYIYANDATEAAQFAIKEWNNGHIAVEFEFDPDAAYTDKYGSYTGMKAALKLLGSKIRETMSIVGYASEGNYIIVIFESK
ncbi:MAG: hypothetical protein J5659_02140 [Clostridia bacterium]|nr:hypothetical protein [Clostridia bacterium]